MWSIGAGLNNVTFRNNFARPHPGQNCCYVSFGGQLSSFIDSHGEGCGLTPRRGISHGNEGLVVWGSPSANPRLFGGAWNSSSTAVVRNVTGTCAGSDGCPLCVLTAVDGDGGYPSGFPGRNVNPACNITRAKKALL